MTDQTKIIDKFKGINIEEEVIVTHIYKACKNGITYTARNLDEIRDKINKSFSIYLNKIKNACLDYELCHDPCEIEINIIDGKVWLCDYSVLGASYYDPEPIFEICNADDINCEDVKEICDENNWLFDS